MTAESLLQSQQEKFDALIGFIASLPEGKLSSPVSPGKWSNGQQVMHLVLSTRAVTQGLLLPKAVLAEKFGTRSEAVAERDYDTLISMYTKGLSGGLVAPARLSPEPVEEAQKPELIAAIRKEFEGLSSALQTWSEAELSQYLLPHPAFGSLTVREMLIFTLFHTDHHMGQMRR